MSDGQPGDTLWWGPTGTSYTLSRRTTAIAREAKERARRRTPGCVAVSRARPQGVERGHMDPRRAVLIEPRLAHDDLCRVAPVRRELVTEAISCIPTSSVFLATKWSPEQDFARIAGDQGAVTGGW